MLAKKPVSQQVLNESGRVNVAAEGGITLPYLLVLELYLLL